MSRTACPMLSRASPARMPALTRSLERHEAMLFLDTVRGHRFEAMFTVALSLGLREGEILGLRWQDVDLDAGRLQVMYALQRIKLPCAEKGKLELIAPKTDRSRRVILLPQGGDRG